MHCTFLGGLFLSPLSGQDIEAVQQSAREWIRVESEKSRLLSDWEWQKDVLLSTREGLQRRCEVLENQRDRLSAAQTETKLEIEGLKAKADTLAKELEKTEVHLQRSSEALIRLKPMLPPQLSSSLDLAYQNLTDPSLSSSEKLQQVVTILNRCSQFNQAVTYSEEIVYPENNSEGRVMKVIYWGLSHAYALDSQSGSTYLGRPQLNEWGWESLPELSEPLHQLMAILKEDTDPDFVTVPMQIDLQNEENADS